MGEKPVGGLIAIIAVALLSVITFGLVATNQANRDAQVVEATVSTSEEVVNAGEDGSDNQSGSPIGAAQSADSNSESSGSDSDTEETTNADNSKDIENFQNRSQGNTPDSPDSSEENNTPTLLQSDSPQSSNANNNSNENSNTDNGENNRNSNAGDNGNENSNSGNNENDDSNDETGGTASLTESNTPNNNFNTSSVTETEDETTTQTSVDPDWDSSSIEVTGDCKVIGGVNVAKFVVANVGDGNMEGPVPYRVYVDGVEVESGMIDPIDSDESIDVLLNYAGDKIRLEVERRPGHPAGSETHPRADVENCIPTPDDMCHATVAHKDPTYGEYEGKHAVYLKGLGASYKPVNPDGLKWQLFDDGTAILQGEVEHIDDDEKVFYVYFALSGKSFTSGHYTGSKDGPKIDEMYQAFEPIANGGAGLTTDDWRYYSEITGYLIGKEKFEGIEVEITGNGPYFQVGYGANLKNLNYGAATWFNYEVVKDPGEIFPSKKTGKGDINVDLPDCAPPEEKPNVKLNLTAICIDGDEAVWRVTNENEFTVQYSVRGEDFYRDATPGLSFFSTEDRNNANTTVIEWYNPYLGKIDDKTKAHNNQPCVGHVTFDKEWLDTDGQVPAVVDDYDYIIRADSSIGYALCGYNEYAEFVCDYYEKDDDNDPNNDKSKPDLVVPFGEKYTVTEKDLGVDWTIMAGADVEGTTPLTEYTNVNGYTETYEYDIDGRYCEDDPTSDYDKYCVHTVVNKYTPQVFECDSLYYVNHVGNGENDSPLFRVDLVDGDPNIAYLEFIQNFDFDQVHIAASLDGGLIYGFDEDGKGIQVIDVNPLDGDQTPAPNPNGNKIKDQDGKVVKGITQAATSPNGNTYIGSANTNEIYVVVDFVTSEVKSLGKIEIAGSGGQTVNIGGADIAFDAEGYLYVMTRSNSEIYKVELATNLVGESLGKFGKSTGLAVLDKGTGNFAYSDTGPNTVVVVDPSDPSDKTIYKMEDGEGDPGYSAIWGDMTGGCLDPLPENDADLVIEKTASVDSVEVGLPFNYTIVVTNVGEEGTATNVVVTDTLPTDYVEFISVSTDPDADPDYCEHANGEITCNIGDLDPQESIEITISVKAEAVGEDIPNTAYVTSDQDEDDDDDIVDINEPRDACVANVGAVSYSNYNVPNANTIDADRLDPMMALGVPEDVDSKVDPLNFTTLGRGGSIELYFEPGTAVKADGTSDPDFYVYETSWGYRDAPPQAYPEKVQVEVYYDGAWHAVGEIIRTEGVDIDGIVPYALGVRLTDTTEFDDSDGYDVDGISCEPPPPPPEPEDPYEDYVCEPIAILDYDLAPTKNGGTVPANRSTNRLPAPDGDGKILSIENDDTNNFISLGLNYKTPDVDDAWIIFDFGENNVLLNAEGNEDLLVVETSWNDQNRPWEKYPEQAEVYVSKDMKEWTLVGTDRKDMTFDLGALDWARYVMLVDTTPEDSVSGDGFDVDGIAGLDCGPKPEPPPASECLAFDVVDHDLANEGSIATGRTDEKESEFAEMNDSRNVPINFVSLGGVEDGQGGYVILEPQDGAIYVDENPTLNIYETTYGEGTQHQTCNSYYEVAKVYVRQGNGGWILATPIADGIDDPNSALSICRDGSVDISNLGIEYVSQIKIVDAGSTTPDGYDLDGLTCQKPEPEEPPYKTCEMLFYSHNPDAPNEANLYQVYLNDVTGDAEMYLLDSLDGGDEYEDWGDSHIASNADGTILYLIENKSPYRLGVYNVADKDFDAIFEDFNIRGVTQAAVHPETGDLYVGSSQTNMIYLVDTSDGSSTSLGKVKTKDGTGTININGADIAFGADGTFYLATRATNKIYEVDLDTMMIVETVAENTEMNGMTISDSGKGQFVYASRSADAFVRINDDNSRTSFGVPVAFNNADIQWGDMATCITYEEPDEPDDSDKPKDPPEQCDALFNHVTNGSFEEPVVEHSKNWDVYESDEMPGWKVEWSVPAVVCDGGDPVLEYQNGDLGLATPVSGTQYAELDSDCGGPDNRQGGEVTTIISQDIKTKPGKSYTFEFYVRSRTGTMDFVAMWDGAEVVAESVTTEWTKFSISGLIADADGMVTISFEDKSQPDSFGVFLDAVAVYEDCEDDNPNPDGQICIALEDFQPGQSVEGSGALHPDMALTTTNGNTVALFDDETPSTYGAPNGNNSRPNGCLVDGFGDNSSQNSRLHDYVFEFENGKIVTDFSITMFDFGDYNPARAESHKIELVGYDAYGNVVATDTLEYTSSSATNPRTSNEFGDLYLTGDACDAEEGEAGLYNFNIANAEGIKTVKVLYHNDGTNSYGGDRPSDPNIAFGEVCFDIEDEPEEPKLTCDDYRVVYEDEPGGRIHVERAMSLGIDEFDSGPVEGDGWTSVGRTNGNSDNGTILDFAVVDGIPYVLIERNNGEVIVVTPVSLDPRKKGQTRVMNTVEEFDMSNFEGECGEIPDPDPDPEVPVCETLFFADNPRNTDRADLYSIYLNDGNAEMTLLDDQTGFGNSHIAASNDGSKVYFIESKGQNNLGVYDVENNDMYTVGSIGVAGVNQAAVQPQTGHLYFTSSNTDRLYKLDVNKMNPADINLGDVMDLGEITKGNGSKLQLDGSDIVFDADGKFYVGSNKEDKIFEVDLDTMTIVSTVINIGSNINGIAIDNNGKLGDGGEFVYAGQGKKFVTRNNDGNYPTVFEDGTFTFENGDMSTSCVEPETTTPTPTKCEAGTGLGIASDFNVFVLGDFNSSGSDSQGRMAIGGNAYITSYGIASALGDEWNGQGTLIVGGDLDFSNGQVYKGDVIVGGTATLAQNANILNGSLLSGTPIDFGAAETELKDLSALYESYAANGTATLMYGTVLELEGTDPDVNIFDVDGADIEAASTLNIDVPNGSLVIINVSGETVDVEKMGLEKGLNPSYVLYNFYEATSLSITDVGVKGSLLAPHAHINFNNGHIDGTMVAASIEGYGEYHDFQFEGCIEEPDTDPEVDLEITKTGPDMVYVDDAIEYTIVGTNNGPEDAGTLLEEGTLITDTLPDSVDLLSVSWVKGTSEGKVSVDCEVVDGDLTCTDSDDEMDYVCEVVDGVITCDIGTLEVMESVTATVNVSATEAGSVVNYVRIDPAMPDDSDDSNNEDEHTTLVKERCELDPEVHLDGSIKQAGETDLAYFDDYDAENGETYWIGVVTNNSDDCTYEVGMASYEKWYGGGLGDQELFDTYPEHPGDGWGRGADDDPQGVEVGPNDEVKLYITAPACATQMDLFYDASHLGVYDDYDQVDADMPPLVLPEFNTNEWGPLGKKYGPRLLAAKHINNNDDCAGTPPLCEFDYSDWMTTMSSTDNTNWDDIPNQVLVVEGSVYIQSFLNDGNNYGKPKWVEYTWLIDGQEVSDHTENSKPYYSNGDNKAWTPATSGQLHIVAHHRGEYCNVEQTVDIVVEEQIAIAQANAVAEQECPITVTLDDTIASNDGSTVFNITDTVTIGATLDDISTADRIRYNIDDDTEFSELSEITLAQAQQWAGDDGEFLLYVVAERDIPGREVPKACSSVNVKITVNQ